MPEWELGPPLEPPALSREEAIEIALSSPVSSPELRGLPVDAEYGSPLHMRYFGNVFDAWKIAVDVRSLGWEVGYEGPGLTRINGETYAPEHVLVPKVRAAIIVVDDKRGERVSSGTEAEPDGEHRIAWRKVGDT